MSEAPVYPLDDLLCGRAPIIEFDVMEGGTPKRVQVFADGQVKGVKVDLIINRIPLVLNHLTAQIAREAAS